MVIHYTLDTTLCREIVKYFTKLKYRFYILYHIEYTHKNTSVFILFLFRHLIKQMCSLVSGVYQYLGIMEDKNTKTDMPEIED